MSNSISMATPHPNQFPIKELEGRIERGELLIPQFQREFVWKVRECAKLIDSILKNYPVGMVTIWQTQDRLRSVKEICGQKFPQPKPGYPANYVLDGQQRLTSIYAAIKGLVIEKADYGAIYLLLDGANDDDAIVTTDVSGKSANRYISIKDLYSAKASSLASRYDQAMIDVIDDYRDRLKGYPIPAIELTDSTLGVATEIFTRINTSGKRLTAFEIISAKVYDEKRKFDLVQKREEQQGKWEGANYETIPDGTVLQALALCLKGSCKKDVILSLTSDDVISVWDNVDKAFATAIDYFTSYFKIPASRFLPYDAIILPFVYYFYKHGGPHPELAHEKLLSDYFWRTAIAQRYTEGLVSKVSQDVGWVQDVIDGKSVNIELSPINVSKKEMLNSGAYSTGSAYTRAFLCLYAAQTPRSLDNGANVSLDNSWLDSSNAKNNHHFFPKAYMKKFCPRVGEKKVNNVVNIILLDSHLNKTVIKDRAPSDYMKDFKTNPDLKGTLASHLIGDMNDFGINTDSYDKFFDARVKMIQNEIVARIIARKGDVLQG